MIFVILFLAEIIFFFFLSQTLTRLLSRFFSIQMLSFLFLPGVIIHELSHFFMAIILFVEVSDIEFLPKIINDRVKLGSVAIAKTDPIRRLLIGFSPIISGLSIFFFLGYYFGGNIIFLFYLLFAIANTMFSSKKDLEGALALFLVVVILFLAFYILGFRPELPVLKILSEEKIINAVKIIDLSLLIPLVMDLAIVSILRRR